LKKRSKKLLLPWAWAPIGGTPTQFVCATARPATSGKQKFFASFFQKKALASFASSHPFLTLPKRLFPIP
jgi:hypothetical protein